MAHTTSTRPDAWVIFDNTVHGHAIQDAQRLKQRLQKPPLARLARGGG